MAGDPFVPYVASVDNWIITPFPDFARGFQKFVSPPDFPGGKSTGAVKIALKRYSYSRLLVTAVCLDAAVHALCQDPGNSQPQTR